MIKLLDNIEIQTALPLDNRSKVKTLSERDNIPQTVRYLGLEVYVSDEKKKYRLIEGITNSHWVELKNINKLSELETDDSNMTVTKIEKDKWNGKADANHTHTASSIGSYTKEETNNLLNNKVDKVISINVGNGLIGGGNLESNVLINMDYASSLEIEELLNDNLIKEVLELATEQDIRNLFVGTKLESSPVYNLSSLSTDESKVVNMRLLSLFNDLLLQRVKDNVNVMIGPKVDSSLNLIAGKGLVGGGTLESNVTFSLDYATTSEIEGILK